MAPILNAETRNVQHYYRNFESYRLLCFELILSIDKLEVLCQYTNFLGWWNSWLDTILSTDRLHVKLLYKNLARIIFWDHISHT